MYHSYRNHTVLGLIPKLACGNVRTGPRSWYGNETHAAPPTTSRDGFGKLRVGSRALQGEAEQWR